jgi:hypothetical protein
LKLKIERAYSFLVVRCRRFQAAILNFVPHKGLTKKQIQQQMDFYKIEIPAVNEGREFLGPLFPLHEFSGICSSSARR